MLISLFGTTSIVKNIDKQKWMYGGCGITFERKLSGILIMTMLEML